MSEETKPITPEVTPTPAVAATTPTPEVVPEAVTPPTAVQEAELATPAPEAKPLAEGVPAVVAPPTTTPAAEIEIIESELAKAKDLDSKNASVVTEQLEKLKAMTAKLEEQQAAVTAEKKELDGGRKGYATVPQTPDSDSAQPVKKDSKEVYDTMTNAQRYDAFEKNFR